MQLAHRFRFALTIMFLCTMVLSAGEQSTKQRTLSQLVELALNEGRDKTIPPNMAEYWGYGKVEIPTKRLSCSEKLSPDGKEHAVSVILDAREEGKKSPKAILLSVTSVKRKKNSVFVDGWNFLLSLDGQLQRAIRNRGIPGEIEPEQLSTSSRSVQKILRTELLFHTKEMVQAGLSYK